MTPTQATRPAQDKIDHLAAFLTAHLTSACEVSVIARSMDSPIVHALDVAHDTLAAKAVTVRVVLLQGSLARWGGQESEPGYARDVRMALNPRLLEAHEQLVIGNRAVWIGDCMRRDPAKRDAYAQEKVGCSMTATFAALSFDKLWALGAPFVPAVPALASVPTVMPRSDVNR